MTHKPRRLVGGQVRFPSEVEHALGALDGKHIPSDVHDGMAASTTTTPGLGGCRLQVPVGGLGAAMSSSDAQILKYSVLRHKIEDGTIGFPESESLVDDGPKVQYFILRDDAFPLKL